MTDFIFDSIDFHPFNTLRIQVVSENTTSFLGCWDRKWSYSGHDVDNYLVRFQRSDDSFVLVMQPGIPVHE
jgi:hypothetical protein